LTEEGGVYVWIFFASTFGEYFLWFFFFFVIGQPRGVGGTALLILFVGGAIWYINRNSLALMKEGYRLFLIEV